MARTILTLVAASAALAACNTDPCGGSGGIWPFGSDDYALADRAACGLVQYGTWEVATMARPDEQVLPADAELTIASGAVIVQVTDDDGNVWEVVWAAEL